MTEYENYHHDRGKTQDAAVDPQLEQWLAESEPQLTKLLQHIQSHHSKRGMHPFLIRHFQNTKQQLLLQG